jgi:hypothetical protein
MPMSDGKNVLKKIAFQIGDKFFRFAINPESMVHAKPHRTTAVKTKSRIIIEDFQSDIPAIVISGTTGFNPTGKASDRGIEKIKELKSYIEAYAELGGNGSKASEDFYFHNFTNDESYVVHLSPEGVTFSQDVNQPLLHRYEIKLVVLRKATDPADEDIVNPEIGNRYPSVTLPSPIIPNTAITMPSPILGGNPILIPSPVIPSTGGVGAGAGSTDGSGGTYDPASGNGDIYNQGSTGPYIPNTGSDPINPQAPSPAAYQYGQTGLGFIIGYYGRRY